MIRQTGGFSCGATSTRSSADFAGPLQGFDGFDDAELVAFLRR